MLLASLAVTPLRRLSPRLAWVIRFRRLLGLYAFFYATLHLATYIFLFSGYDLPMAIDGVRRGHPQAVLEQWRQTWPTILDDIKKRRFIQVGFAAWCILFMLAVTSPAFIARAVGGTAWRRLHRLVYIAGALALVHYWWLVKTGVLTPWKDTAVLIVLLAARLIYSQYKKQRSYSSLARVTE
jgi:sulfoxide reductase heme-binding subunit YedZ